MPVRYPGAMLSPPDEGTVADYLSIGMANVRSPGSENEIRLLITKAFWQHAFARPADHPDPPVVGPAEAIRSAEAAAEAAHRIGRADLESAALDGLSACHIPDGDYRASLDATKRRLDLIDQQRDIWEIGDTFAMNAWMRYHIGHYRLSREHAQEGFDRTVDDAPSLALHCLRWKAQASYQLGEWDSVLDSYRFGRRLLEDKKDTPPHYVPQRGWDAPSVQRVEPTRATPHSRTRSRCSRPSGHDARSTRYATCSELRRRDAQSGGSDGPRPSVRTSRSRAAPPPTPLAVAASPWSPAARGPP